MSDLNDEVKRGFVGDDPSRKRKKAPRSVASSLASRSSPPSQHVALERFLDLTEERYAKSAVLNELKEKRIVLQTEDEALSLHCKYGDILHKQRERLKILESTDDYNSDGSEALEINNSILLYIDRMQVASAALLSINTATKV